MGSVSKPRCARGINCYHVLKLGSEAPPSVSREGELCRKCLQQEPSLEEMPPGQEELFRAARALLDNNFNAPQDIIPTVVFAEVSAGNRHLEELKESLAANDLMSERGRLLRQRFAQAFEFHSIWDFTDGALIVRQNPVHIGAPSPPTSPCLLRSSSCSLPPSLLGRRSVRSPPPNAGRCL